ncbi:MAG: hypothetical protein R2727_03765 [Bacteroidales bacterium]
MLEIDNTSLKGLAIDKISDRLKGDPDTEITVKVRRGDNEIVTPLVRKKIRNTSRTLVWYAG